MGQLAARIRGRTWRRFHSGITPKDQRVATVDSTYKTSVVRGFAGSSSYWAEMSDEATRLVKDRFGARRIGCRYEVFERGSLMHIEWFDHYEEAEAEAKKINEVLTKIDEATIKSIVQ